MGISLFALDFIDYLSAVLGGNLSDESGECGVCGGVCGGKLCSISKVSSFRLEIIE